MAFHVPHEFRVRSGMLGSTNAIGNNGAFLVVLHYKASGGGGMKSQRVKCIASDQAGWEHVSVSPSIDRRCPTWDEMQAVKELFWGPEDCVLQFHPPQEDYVNNHPYVLHLWRPIDIKIALPPKFMV